jgi:hypothetical protein
MMVMSVCRNTPGRTLNDSAKPQAERDWEGETLLLLQKAQFLYFPCCCDHAEALTPFCCLLAAMQRRRKGERAETKPEEIDQPCGKAGSGYRRGTREIKQARGRERKKRSRDVQHGKQIILYNPNRIARLSFLSLSSAHLPPFCPLPNIRWIIRVQHTHTHPHTHPLFYTFTYTRARTMDCNHSCTPM